MLYYVSSSNRIIQSGVGIFCLCSFYLFFFLFGKFLGAIHIHIYEIKKRKADEKSDRVAFSLGTYKGKFIFYVFKKNKKIKKFSHVVANFGVKYFHESTDFCSVFMRFSSITFRNLEPGSYKEIRILLQKGFQSILFPF